MITIGLSAVKLSAAKQAFTSTERDKKTKSVISLSLQIVVMIVIKFVIAKKPSRETIINNPGVSIL